eukprot:scaffold266108_cov24-Prasinocladus_malaysianus.AAC.2
MAQHLGAGTPTFTPVILALFKLGEFTSIRLSDWLLVCVFKGLAGGGIGASEQKRSSRVNVCDSFLITTSALSHSRSLRTESSCKIDWSSSFSSSKGDGWAA